MMVLSGIAIRQLNQYFTSVMTTILLLCEMSNPIALILPSILLMLICHRNSTRSLHDSDVVYFNIHGRRYCQEYYMPNDEDEQTRHQILHEVYLYLFKQRLTTVPLDNPSKIIDIGAGTGEWAMSIGDEYPDCEIIGTDIGKVFPHAVPLNVFFEIDDAEAEGGWTWPEDEFDLIHFRSMAGAFKNWKYIYEETLKHLKPGGWVEVVDFDHDKGLQQFFPTGSPGQHWLDALREGSQKAGRPMGIEHLDPAYLTELGFVDVTIEEYEVPIGIWPEDTEAKRIGKHFLVTQLDGLEALCLRTLTEQMMWSLEEVLESCRIVTEYVGGSALCVEKWKKPVFKVMVLKGRKPQLDEPGV